MSVIAWGVSAALGSAQAQPEEEDADIVVTGTRIPRPDLTSASPVASFTAEDVSAHGALQVEDFLNTLPQASPDYSRTANNPGDGMARVNLRGLGANRTLTLLNGRRLAPAGVESAADLNSLPTAIVERIEVVTGGASAVYGSDAVAGVVNFITRDDFEGAEFATQFDTFDAGDGDVFNANAVWGAYALDRRLNVLVYLDYVERQPVLQGERAFTSQSITEDSSTGELFTSGSPTGPNGLITSQAVGGVLIPGRLFIEGGATRPFNPATDLYNFAPDNYLQVPLERWAAGAFVRFDISPALEGRLELMYSAPRSGRQLAAAPFTNFVSVPIAADFFSPETQAHLAANFDPDNDGIARFRFTRRLSDVGPRQSVFERDNYRAMAALEGALGAWEWEGAYTYARNDTHAAFNNDASLSRILQGVLIDPVTGECVDPTGGCVPVNLFGPGTLSAEAADFIGIDDIVEDTRVEQETLTLFTRGEVLELPAGAVRASVGGEWRRVSTVYAPSPTLATGDSAGFLQSPAVAGAFEVREAFGEVLVPLMAGAPFAQLLEAEAGARFTEHSTAGSHWTWKFGVQWRPIEPLRIRGMVQRAVRAPNVLELYETQRMSITFVDAGSDFCSATSDPVATGLADVCIAQGMDPSQVGVYDPASGYVLDVVASGNPGLSPETADTLTIGADWEFGDPWRARLSADYFEIELSDAILAADPLLDCAAAADPSDAACALVHRDGAGFITLLENRPVNYARAIVEGVDLGASLGFAAPSWLALTADAEFEVGVLATYYLRAASAASERTPLLDCVGYFGCGSYDLLGAVTPEFVATSTLRYRAGPVSAMLRWRHIGATDNSDPLEAAAGGLPPPIMAIPNIDAVNYVDLSFGYEFGERARFSFGVDNVFEEDPPQMAANQVQANTDPARFDVFGRRFFARLSYRFP